MAEAPLQTQFYSWGVMAGAIMPPLLEALVARGVLPAETVGEMLDQAAARLAHMSGSSVGVDAALRVATSRAQYP